MFKHRLIRGNKGRYKPRRMVFVATHTYREKRESYAETWNANLALGCMVFARWEDGFITRRRQQHFLDTETFWTEVEKRLEPKYTTWIVGHRIGHHLTVLRLWERLDGGQYHITRPKRAAKKRGESPVFNEDTKGLFVFGDPPTIICLEHVNGGRILCVDTRNYFRSSTTALGKWTGLPAIARHKHAADLQTAKDSCMRETKIVERAFVKLVNFSEEHDLGCFKYTSPSMAMQAFRHRFMKTKLFACDDPKVRRIERAGNFGGQTEAFRTGRIVLPCYLLDVKSLFPSVMENNFFPVKLERACLDDRWTDTPPDVDLRKVMAEVLINTEEPDYPYRNDGKVIYPVGCFRTVLCGPELVRAHELGRIESWGNWTSYRMSFLFRDYVRYFGAIKDDAEKRRDNVEYELAKLLLNSLYGKWSQYAPTWVCLPDVIPEVDWGTWPELAGQTGTKVLYQAIAGWTFRMEEKREKATAMPAISAFVTSFAREHMRKARSCIRHGTLLYQGIDSLVVDHEAYDELWAKGWINASERGKLRTKLAGDECEILGVGWYRIDGHWCRAGLKPEAEPLSRLAWDVELYETLPSVLSHAPESGPVQWVTASNSCKGYRKRWTDGDGCTHPIRVYDDSSATACGPPSKSSNT